MLALLALLPMARAGPDPDPNRDPCHPSFGFSHLPHCDATLSPQRRARALAARLTLAQKADFVRSTYQSGDPKLGLPQVQATTCLMGAVAGGQQGRPMANTTVLPCPITLAATWDRELLVRSFHRFHPFHPSHRTHTQRAQRVTVGAGAGGGDGRGRGPQPVQRPGLRERPDLLGPRPQHLPRRETIPSCPPALPVPSARPLTPPAPPAPPPPRPSLRQLTPTPLSAAMGPLSRRVRRMPLSDGGDRTCLDPRPPGPPGGQVRQGRHDIQTLRRPHRPRIPQQSGEGGADGV
eukprot:COSAG04_NODE_15_length_40535_cov_25.319888_29_plen_292_part_00